MCTSKKKDMHTRTCFRIGCVNQAHEAVIAIIAQIVSGNRIAKYARCNIFRIGLYFQRLGRQRIVSNWFLSGRKKGPRRP
jgi:hypothetical protein